MRRSFQLTLAASIIALSGCAAIGTAANILGALGGLGGAGTGTQQQGQLNAQIQQVDTYNRRLIVRTQQGQQGPVRFDNQTVVVYNQRQYPVTALEPGDVVVMQIQQVAQNELYTPRIDVMQPVQTGFVRGL